MYVTEVRNTRMEGIVTIMRVIINDRLLQMPQLEPEGLRNWLVITAVVTKPNRYREGALDPKGMTTRHAIQRIIRGWVVEKVRM